MKKLVSLFVFFALMITMASCAASKNEPPIDFGKKYGRVESGYYVFEKDQTGYYECHYVYEDSYSLEYSYTLSGRVSFVWRVASDGAVYLFETETAYYDDHTEGKSLELIDEPIWFAEEFFAYTYGTSYGDRTRKYVKEGTPLAASIEK